MKVVLFCGGLGTRLRDYSDQIPKPMVPIGYRPVLWHVMKYYARFGYNDFVLCLGYKADVIKNYFLNYDESLTNDFVFENGGKDIQLLHSDIDDWRITFVDTGLTSNIAQRLLAVKPHLEGEEVFLANYSDGLTDFPLPELVDEHRKAGAIASFLCIKPYHSFHTVNADATGIVKAIQDTTSADFWVNGGYFVLNREIFDYIKDGDELVREPFQRLIAESKLRAHKYTGFWGCMDTFKEKQMLDDLYDTGTAPWMSK
ncbi:MAG: glucose-1-phosphate cytidylyltransferase [Kiritimatiellales bacterium]|nr:glucose-1-phosphate cytidylyltransferase [Kiritimatiellales bacterium]